MFLVLVDSNGKRAGDRIWELADAKAALAALEHERLWQCALSAHLAVRSDVDESFVSTIQTKWNRFR